MSDDEIIGNFFMSYPRKDEGGCECCGLTPCLKLSINKYYKNVWDANNFDQCDEHNLHGCKACRSKPILCIRCDQDHEKNHDQFLECWYSSFPECDICKEQHNLMKKRKNYME